MAGYLHSSSSIANLCLTYWAQGGPDLAGDGLWNWDTALNTEYSGIECWFFLFFVFFLVFCKRLSVAPISHDVINASPSEAQLLLVY